MKNKFVIVCLIIQAKNDIIEVLKDQLEHERDQNKKLSKLNENLLNQLDKNQTLLDQQQRLSLNNINNIKMLESELEEKKEEKEEKENKWYHIFKRKK
ncbi:hypothetical protein [Enterococcus faecium]|uniref:hypothetical protein n=1 Tax=Enterococcus faecium TaxID=1352 RepID=UPI00128E2E17|nr:hypothetical protein [Enterococcus faecium]